jgi:hypothetical protein
MPPPPQLAEEARFLHLLFEQAESKIHVVMLHLDKHGITNGAAAVGVVRVVWQDSRSRFFPQSLFDAGQ